MRAHSQKRLYRLLLLAVVITVLPVAGATSPTTTSQKVATVESPAANEAAARPTQNGVSRTDPVRNDAGTVMLATLNTGSFPAYVLGGPTVAGPSGSAAFKASSDEAIFAEQAGSDSITPTNWDGVLATFLLLGFFLSRRAR